MVNLKTASEESQDLTVELHLGRYYPCSKAAFHTQLLTLVLCIQSNTVSHTHFLGHHMDKIQLYQLL